MAEKDKTEKECEVCDVLTGACDKLGDKKYCSDLIEDLKNDKITEEELISNAVSKFGEDDFMKKINETIKEKDRLGIT